jgi:hypothetical protein
MMSKTPAFQRSSGIDLGYWTGSGTVHRSARRGKFRQQDRAAHGHISYSVGRDTERREAQAFMDEEICPAHRQAAREWRIGEKAEVTGLMGVHGTDEGIRPPEWAVDPDLVSPGCHLEYRVVVSVTRNLFKDGTPSSPFDAGDGSPVRLRGKVNPGSDHRSRLLR